jgi:hypothetical protein
MRKCINLRIKFEKFVDIGVTYKRLWVKTPHINTLINARKYPKGRGMVKQVTKPHKWRYEYSLT